MSRKAKTCADCRAAPAEVFDGDSMLGLCYECYLKRHPTSTATRRK